MTRYTSAYSNFVLRLKEIDILRGIMRGALEESAHTKAVCRSSVVLLSSHIEGYIEGLGEVILDRIYRKNLGKND